MPALPPLAEKVNPDQWLEAVHGQAFTRKGGSDGCVKVDNELYYIKQALAGQQVVLFVNAPEHAFEVWYEGTYYKRIPIKGLYGMEIPFENYAALMQEEARSSERRLRLTYRSLRQLSLWA